MGEWEFVENLRRDVKEAHSTLRRVSADLQALITAAGGEEDAYRGIASELREIVGEIEMLPKILKEIKDLLSYPKLQSAIQST